MSNEKLSSVVPAEPETNNEATRKPSRAIRRRSFLKGLGVAGAAVTTGALLKAEGLAQSSTAITQGYAAILHFLAAAEIIESDLWLQYQEFL